MLDISNKTPEQTTHTQHMIVHIGENALSLINALMASDATNWPQNNTNGYGQYDYGNGDYGNRDYD
jgi:hypothetical protein